MKGKMAFYAVVGICMYILLNLMSVFYFRVQQMYDSIQLALSTILLQNLWFFLFGIGLEAGLIRKMVFKRKVHIRWGLLVFSLILLSVSSVPLVYWSLWYGLKTPGFGMNPFRYPPSHAILVVVSGVLLVRSFFGKSDRKVL